MDRDLPPLRLLRVLDIIVREGDMSRAAARLNVTLPALSQSVRQLEALLGLPVLDRSRRPARPTEAGLRLAAATRDGLAHIAQAVAAIRTRDGRERMATISCTVGFATHWLMPRLAGFYGRHPEIAVSVMATHEESPPLDPDTDLAIRYGSGRWADGRAELLFAERVRPVCSPAFAARIDPGVAALRDGPLIDVAAGDARWTGWTGFFRDLGLGVAPGAAPGAGRLRFGNYVQATQAALNDQGVMLGWRSITGDLEAEGRLVAPFGLELVPEERYFVVIPDRHPPAAMGAATGAVRDWLLDVSAAGN